ncbi:VirB2 family type IV secretion system major pilin TrwL [Bartonella phoceensis]|uniref:VirB2 family type IV secretion system major pilin TrwL n=1 Tax=Bartonella phoceensis TaxID=270249 RepID=UPI001ABA94B3|nr:VirB2 family type IV secretion system major pilin TrwL [Bartonella phoceensis]
MEQLSIFRTIVGGRFVRTVTMAMAFFMTHPLCAQAQNLTKAGNILKKIRDELNIIVPIAAAVILLCLAIGYAGRYIEKDTFVRWAIGVVIAGSAVEIANVLFKP